ncbi:MAG TPA: glycosyltransferase family 4 protein [archaeon]|nr:glycosyltransferase family 4 protein [archaeon]
MKILFLVPYPPQGASNRFRVLQFLQYLTGEGLGCHVRPFYSESIWPVLYKPGHYREKLFHGLVCTLNRVLDLFRCLTYDIVFIHREAYPVGPAWFEGLLRLMGKPYVYDFDDAIFLPNVARSNRLFARWKCPGKIGSIIRGSRITIAGNNYLAAFARAMGARQVEVLPTVVDTDRFVPRAEGTRREDKVVIGWIGSLTTIDFVESFKPVMKRVLELCPGRACFRIVGGNLTGPLPEGIACVAWSSETELAELQSFDIGIMPMPDNAWTQGKCAFKAIEYMAVGIPAVCSPVGMNRQLIRDGVNGFLPEEEEAWVEVLCRLAGDEALRSSIGAAGRETVERHYSVQVMAPRFKEVILKARSGVQNS